MLIDPIAFFCWDDIVFIVVWFQDWSRGTTLFKGCHRVPFTRKKVPKSAVFMILEALQVHQVRTIVFRFRPMGCNLFWAQAAGSWLYTLGVPPLCKLCVTSGSSFPCPDWHIGMVSSHFLPLMRPWQSTSEKATKKMSPETKSGDGS